MGEGRSILFFFLFLTTKSGQLGLGSSVTAKNTKLVYPTQMPVSNLFFVKLALGNDFTLCLSEEGDIYSFGKNGYGQCGHADRKDVLIPTKINIDQKFSFVSCGNSHSTAITNNGQLYTWGSGENNQLGHGTNGDEFYPRLLTELSKLSCQIIGCGAFHTVALINQVAPYSNDLRILLNNPLFSDIIFVIDGKKIYAHRCILSARSSYFRQLFQSAPDLKEIPLNVDSKSFLTILEFLYTDQANVSPSESSKESPLYQLSEEYGISTLIQLFNSLNEGKALFLPSSLWRDISCLLENPMFSDFAFKVEGTMIHVHKCILSLKNQFFKTMFASGMKETTKSETQIADISYSTLKNIIDYCYTDDVKITGENIVELLMAAYKYHLINLKQICEDFIRDNIEISNASSLFQMGCFYESEQLKSFCLDFIIKHYSKICRERDFQTLDPKLKEIIRKAVKGSVIEIAPKKISATEYLHQYWENDEDMDDMDEEEELDNLINHLDVGKSIERERRKKNYDRTQFANELGIKVSLLKQYETNVVIPSKETLRKMDEILDTETKLADLILS